MLLVLLAKALDSPVSAILKVSVGKGACFVVAVVAFVPLRLNTGLLRQTPTCRSSQH